MLIIKKQKINIVVVVWFFIFIFIFITLNSYYPVGGYGASAADGTRTPPASHSSEADADADARSVRDTRVLYFLVCIAPVVPRGLPESLQTERRRDLVGTRWFEPTTPAMCSVDKMLIKGIRSFSPDNDHAIIFPKPLTLIVGRNGAGKTVRR